MLRLILLPCFVTLLAQSVELCQLMAPLWQHALRALPGPAPNRSAFSCAGVREFYSTPVNDPYWFEPPKGTDSPPFVFVRNWKCASKAVICNLKAAGWKFQKADSQRKVAAAPRHLVGPSAAHLRARGFWFSFVREPLPRFIAGYGEYMHREFRHALPQNTSGTALSFLRELLSGKVHTKPDQTGAVLHLYSVLGQLRLQGIQRLSSGPLDLIGRLESFEADWSRAAELSNVTLPAWGPKCGAHPQTDRNSGFPPRVAMQQLVEGSLAARAALNCAVLLPDYLCLGYHIEPNACVLEGYVKDLKEFDNLADRIRGEFCADKIEGLVAIEHKPPSMKYEELIDATYEERATHNAQGAGTHRKEPEIDLDKKAADAMHKIAPVAEAQGEQSDDNSVRSALPWVPPALPPIVPFLVVVTLSGVGFSMLKFQMLKRISTKLF